MAGRKKRTRDANAAAKKAIADYLVEYWNCEIRKDAMFEALVPRGHDTQDLATAVAELVASKFAGQETGTFHYDEGLSKSYDVVFPLLALYTELGLRPDALPQCFDKAIHIVPTLKQVSTVLAASRDWRKEIALATSEPKRKTDVDGVAPFDLSVLVASSQAKAKVTRALAACGLWTTHSELVPAGAKIVEDEGRCYAELVDRDQVSFMVPLTKDGTHIIVSSPVLTSYYGPDPDGMIGNALHRLWRVCEYAWTDRSTENLDWVIDVLEAKLPIRTPSSKRRARNKKQKRAAIVKPRWNHESRELRYGIHLVKRFSNRTNAPKQVALLDAFEAAGWAPSISNPFVGEDFTSGYSQKLLHDTLTALNRSIKGKPIRFDAFRKGWCKWVVNRPPSRTS